MAILAIWIEYADNQALTALSAEASALISALILGIEYCWLVTCDG
jgi:hypothetical protein